MLQKSFDILTISLDILYNYFDSLTKIVFRSVSSFQILQQNHSFCIQ